MSDQSEMFYEAKYIYNNVQYCVEGDSNLHFRLENDPDFCKTYLGQNQDCNEIVGLAENEDEAEFRWTRSPILLLIDCYRERMARFRDPKIKNKKLWGEIKTMFLESGYTVTEDMLDRKLRNMKKTYKTILDNKGKRRTGRGSIHWEYFEEFQEMFVVDKTVNVDHSIASMSAQSTPTLDVCVPGTSAAVQGTSTASPGTSAAALRTIPVTSLLPQNLESEELLESSSNNLLQISTISVEPLVNSANTSTPKKFSGKENKKDKATKGRLLYGLRKKQLEIEENRVAELRKLRETIDINNSIQEHRNKLLEQLLLNSNSK